ncbi:MAG: FMN-binding protein [Candidatus Omnitrophica bacterium]|nr:FMN-binding protein [Candidatus Omnitrophota bacterium]
MKKILLITMLILGAAASASGEYLISADKALKKMYKKATHFERRLVSLNDDQQRRIEEDAQIRFGPSHVPQLVVYTAYEGDLIVGRIIEDTVVGKWGPIHYMTAFDTAGTVREVVVLDYHEIRGKPAAKRRFLKQYKGKNAADPIRVRKDIDGITGATITSRSLTDGVRKTAHVLGILEKNN